MPRNQAEGKTQSQKHNPGRPDPKSTHQQPKSTALKGHRPHAMKVGEGAQEEPGEAEPVMAGVADSAVTGDPLALPLVKGMEPVRVLAALPPPGAQVPPLFKLIPKVVPVRVRFLRAQSQPR